MTAAIFHCRNGGKIIENTGNTACGRSAHERRTISECKSLVIILSERKIGFCKIPRMAALRALSEVLDSNRNLADSEVLSQLRDGRDNAFARHLVYGVLRWLNAHWSGWLASCCRSHSRNVTVMCSACCCWVCNNYGMTRPPAMPPLMKQRNVPACWASPGRWAWSMRF